MKKNIIEDYIKEILEKNYGDSWENFYNKSDLIKYLNLKSKAIHSDSKARRSLANWYAIYAILDSYVKHDFVGKKEDYLNFEGFNYTSLFNFQREQYGGSKLQNHGFNNRAIGEFANKTNNSVDRPLIINNNGKYLINAEYLYIDDMDITETVIEIIQQYQAILYAKDHTFTENLKELQQLSTLEEKQAMLKALLLQTSEARIFEIISYAILERHYKKKTVLIGTTKDSFEEYNLELFKTGRTNANDGGIDFVLKPLGRFFQVTEVDSYNKYFLDMDKVNHFPITFVVRTEKTSDFIYDDLLQYGTEKADGHTDLEMSYHNAVEEVITINELIIWLSEMNTKDLDAIIKNIDSIFKMEMNIVED